MTNHIGTSLTLLEFVLLIPITARLADVLQQYVLSPLTASVLQDIFHSGNDQTNVVEKQPASETDPLITRRVNNVSANDYNNQTFDYNNGTIHTAAAPVEAASGHGSVPDNNQQNLFEFCADGLGSSISLPKLHGRDNVIFVEINAEHWHGESLDGTTKRQQHPNR